MSKKKGGLITRCPLLCYLLSPAEVGGHAPLIRRSRTIRAEVIRVLSANLIRQILDGCPRLFESRLPRGCIRLVDTWLQWSV